MKNALLLAAAALTAGCATSSHPTVPSNLGVARRTADLLAVIDQPGPIEVETVASADWVVPRSGLINLDHEKAKDLEDGDEPIQVFFHGVRHPTRGTFIVDTGIEKAQRDAPDRALISGVLGSAMGADQIRVHTALGDWLAAQHAPLAGVLLTHLHLDHIDGLPDVPRGTPIYAGPGETTARAFLNLVVQGITDRALEGHSAIREWSYGDDGVLDVFGDGSLWALWVPGHTHGSTAYLARTPTGPVLLTGDACHTAWGWDHQVEPGTFSADQPKSAESLAKLERLAADHPTLRVRLGHQRHTAE